MDDDRRRRIIAAAEAAYRRRGITNPVDDLIRRGEESNARYLGIHTGGAPPEAVPVTYRGVQLRSTLEGRWCVCFDALGVPWQYEPAPVRQAGRNRWADFYLPAQRVWVEIKPAQTPPDEEMARAICDQTGRPLLWIAGSPRLDGYRATLLDYLGLGVVKGLQLALTRGGDGELWLCDRTEALAFPLPPRAPRLEDDWPAVGAAALKEAYSRARWERFGKAPNK